MSESDARAPKPRPWRYRVSLRALMTLILVVAAALGWRVNRAHTQARAVARVKQAGGLVVYDYQFDGTYLYKNNPSPRVPAWLRRMVGNEHFQEVTKVSFYDKTATDAALAAVGDFDHLIAIIINDASEVTDTGLAHLAGLPRLQEMEIWGLSGITDTGLSHLAELRNLQKLELNGLAFLQRRERWKPPAITDAGLSHLAGVRCLQEVELRNLPLITDAGLAHLAGMPGLRRMSLSLDGITDAGLLTHLSRLTELRELEVWGERLTGAGLACLDRLKSLRTLRLRWYGGLKSGITNEDLAHLEGLVELRELDLSMNKGITAAGLRHMAGLRQLRKLSLDETWVSDQAIADIQATIPGLAVSRIGRPLW